MFLHYWNSGWVETMSITEDSVVLAYLGYQENNILFITVISEKEDPTTKQQNPDRPVFCYCSHGSTHQCFLHIEKTELYSINYKNRLPSSSGETRKAFFHKY